MPFVPLLMATELVLWGTREGSAIRYNTSERLCCAWALFIPRASDPPRQWPDWAFQTWQWPESQPFRELEQP